MEEPRRAARIPEHLEISYTILPNKKTQGYLTKDISMKGVRFSINEFVPVKSLLKVRITLTEIPFSFETVAKVSWVRKAAVGERYDIGLEFSDLPKETSGNLVNYIESILNPALPRKACIGQKGRLGEGEVAMGAEVKKPTKEELEKLGVRSWPIWEKEESDFDWFYDEKETCFFLEGEVEVELPDGKTVRIQKGDLVTFPKGLSCKWHIKKKVRKHYNFE